MRWVYGAAVSLCAAALALAAPPVELPSEVKGEPGAFVTLRGKTEGSVVRFVPLDSGLAVFPADLLADKKATVVSAAKPGRYRVLAYSSVANDPTEPALVTVVIGDAPNPPPVPPKPDPQPDPAPVVRVDSVWVIVVEDSAAGRTVDVAKALNDPFWATLKPKHDYRHYRSTDPVAVSSGYATEAKDVGYPAVLILNAKDGDVLTKSKLTTAADVAAQVKAVTK